MPEYSQKSRTSSPRGFWFNAALFTALGVAGLLMLGLVVRAIFVPPLMRTMAENFTTTRVAWTPSSPLAEEQREVLETRVDSFVDAVREGTVPSEPTLELNQDDLNALLEDAWSEGENEWRLTVTIVNGVVSSVMSFRIDPEWAEGIWRPFAGRFVNGTANLNLAIENGRLRIGISNLVVSGRNAPGWLTRRLQERLDALSLEDDGTREFFTNLEDLRVVGDRVVLTARPEVMR